MSSYGYNPPDSEYNGRYDSQQQYNGRYSSSEEIPSGFDNGREYEGDNNADEEYYVGHNTGGQEFYTEQNASYPRHGTDDDYSRQTSTYQNRDGSPWLQPQYSTQGSQQQYQAPATSRYYQSDYGSSSSTGSGSNPPYSSNTVSNTNSRNPSSYDNATSQQPNSNPSGGTVYKNPKCSACDHEHAVGQGCHAGGPRRPPVPRNPTRDSTYQNTYSSSNTSYSNPRH